MLSLVFNSFSSLSLTNKLRNKFTFFCSSMAVEARRIVLFPSQLILHRHVVKSNQGNANICDTQMDSFVPFPQKMPEPLLPIYQTFDCNQISADSGLTYNIPEPRKRSRDSIQDLDAFTQVSEKQKLSGFSSFSGQDIMFQLQQQQSEINHDIAQYAEKVRFEFEEQRKRQSRMLISVIQQGIEMKIKEKDEEIQRMGKLNEFLQERVKSLYVENQIWRDLAQTNEAIANTLRNNLEQLLANVGGDNTEGVDADDAVSSCGSSDYGRCTAEETMVDGGGNRFCRRCGKRESSVLLLPCRHLCLCTVCGFSLSGSCPVCNSVMDANLHVNMY